jgi:peptidoglycan hydrolase-like protein with peptidoglycan-binding domain
MFDRSILAGALASALALAPAERAAADGAEAFIGGLLGGAIGSAVANQQQRRVVVQERRVVRQRAQPQVNTYQREENRRVQTALNYFGFPAGVADGVLGGNSRSAIGQYQAFMAYPPTGVLTEYEKVFLLSSYDRAVVGGAHTAQVIAANGQGVRGLLIAYRQEQSGVPPVAVAPPVTVVPPAPPAPVEAAAPEPATPDATAETVPAAALPSFVAGVAGASIASYCNRVSLTTSSNGGFVTLAAMGDPQQALGEQFCVARTYAIEQGDSLAGTVQGFSMAEMQTQCEAFAPTMTGYQSRLASQSPEEVRAALQEFVVSTGAPPAQLSANARICLGVGYRSDNAELALASALVLVGLGEDAYGELLGHHLVNGFATPRRPDRGVGWLSDAASALEAGATPLVAGAADHAALLQQAALSLGGGTPGPVLQEAAAPEAGPGFVLPTGAADAD